MFEVQTTKVKQGSLLLHNQIFKSVQGLRLGSDRKEGDVSNPSSVKHFPTYEISLNRFTDLNKPCVYQKLPVIVVWSTLKPIFESVGPRDPYLNDYLSHKPFSINLFHTGFINPLKSLIF